MVKTVCIIGIGLVGGSLAAGLRRQQWSQTVIGVDTDKNSIDKALQMQIIDQGHTCPEALSAPPDVIVVAVPVLKVKTVFKQLTPWLSECQVITDVGSTKQSVINDFKQVFPERALKRFVPAHPIAGREQSGVDAVVDDLFAGRRVIVTPLEETSRQSLQIVTAMWQAVGACVEQLNPRRHDRILAATSHLPHALAFSLVHCLSRQSHTPEIFRYAAGGFADFSRIASSDPGVWRDICLANRTALLQAIADFDNSLEVLRASLNAADGNALKQMFIDAKNARDRFGSSD